MKSILAVATAALGATSAPAASVLDASFDGFRDRGDVYSQVSLAQTFTVVNSGTLTGVDLELVSGLNPPNADLHLQIRKLSSGRPAENDAGPDVLASVRLPNTGVGTTIGWVTFDLADFAVQSGDQFALVLTSSTTAGRYIWIGDLPLGGRPGTYEGGRAYRKDGQSVWKAFTATGEEHDLSFRTFVEPANDAIPEPATWAMLIAGFGLVGGAMRGRQQAGRSRSLERCLPEGKLS